MNTSRLTGSDPPSWWVGLLNVWPPSLMMQYGSLQMTGASKAGMKLLMLPASERFGGSDLLLAQPIDILDSLSPDHCTQR